MTEQTALAILHWFWTAFFAGFGIYLLLKPNCMMRTSCRVLRLNDAADAPRIAAAVERRRASENVSSATGYASAGFAFAMAAIAAFTAISPGLLYAIFCLGLAMMMTALYVQLRNCQPKRVAVLSARKPGTVIPLWAFALTMVSAVCVLALISVPSLALAAAIVFASTTITIFAAWRLTSLPALLQGVDIQAETVLDDRLRFYRSAGVLILAVVQPFVFCSQILSDHAAVVQAAYFATLVVWLAFSVWVVRRMFHKVSFAAQ